MSAIPTSDMLGHKHLRDRVFTALDCCQESQGIEFKQSADWDTLKWQMIRTVMAMGNLRDGGIIIIGVSEKDDTWELEGIKPEHLNSYDIDNIIDIINKYTSPPIEIKIVIVTYRNGTNFLVFQIHEFDDTPYVCKKNGPDDIKKKLFSGDVYLRIPGKAKTRKVTNALEMHELLELAAEKRTRRFIEKTNRLGLVALDTAPKSFDDELEGL